MKIAMSVYEKNNNSNNNEEKTQQNMTKPTNKINTPKKQPNQTKRKTKKKTKKKKPDLPISCAYNVGNSSQMHALAKSKNWNICCLCPALFSCSAYRCNPKHGRNRVQIMCTTCYKGTAELLSLTELKLHLIVRYFIGWNN